MKVLLLSDISNPHTIKWAKGLASKGIEVVIFGLSEFDPSLYSEYRNIQVYSDNFSLSDVKKTDGSFSKIRYLKTLGKVQKIIKKIKPDILHAHYASSYGLLGALCNFHPFVLSVWGSDVYDFPVKSFLHKNILKFNFRRADRILSTSQVMANQTKRFTNKPILVTPFGIDLNLFRSNPVESLFSRNDIVIGTVKTLEEKYGIEYLIRAFKIVKEKNPGQLLKLLIVGGGSLEGKLKQLSKDLEIGADIVFTGKVNYDQTPFYHNMIDISVFPSVLDSESFGVSVIEASACSKPVVVTHVGGLPEVVEDKVSGLIVPPRNVPALADSIDCLVKDKKMRIMLGANGRNRVEKLFNWENNLQQMIDIYTHILGR